MKLKAIDVWECFDYEALAAEIKELAGRLGTSKSGVVQVPTEPQIAAMVDRALGKGSGIQNAIREKVLAAMVKVDWSKPIEAPAATTVTGSSG